MQYDILVSGSWHSAEAELFDDVEVTNHGSWITLSGEFDQAALHGVLHRIRLSGLHLTAVRRRRASVAAPRTRDAELPPEQHRLSC